MKTTRQTRLMAFSLALVLLLSLCLGSVAEAQTASVFGPNDRNNIGISDDSHTTTANYDRAGNSYSAQALQADKILPCNNLTFYGVNFSWPCALAGIVDNWQAAGQILSVTPVSAATTLAFLGSATNGDASGTATITYTDHSTQTFTLGFTDWAHSVLSFNNRVAVTMPYRNTPHGRQVIDVRLFYVDTPLASGKTLQSVTLPSSVRGGQLHVFVVSTRSSTLTPYNNTGISSDANRGAGNFDGSGKSYSAQALSAGDVSPGATVTFNGVSFTWPNVDAGLADNWQAAGQTIAIHPVGLTRTPPTRVSALAFLGSASNGPSFGTATITYTDDTTQTFTLGLSDWTLNGGRSSPSFGNGTSTTMSYRNTPTGAQTINTYLFYTDVAVQVGKTLKSVTLPSAVDQGQLHVFAIGQKAAATGINYNNVGISDNSNTAAANFDSGGNSYSTQVLQALGITPGHSLLFNGVSFTMPNEPSGALDNWQAEGQTILLSETISTTTGANTLAFLGSASNGPSFGTATITYTDDTTQTFTLGLSDWTLNGGRSSPSFGNLIVLTMPYRNTVGGRQNTLTYVFYGQVPLQTSKTPRSITLPASTNQGKLHVFALGIATLSCGQQKGNASACTSVKRK